MRCTLRTAIVFTLAAAIRVAPAHAVILEYTSETAYLDDLAALGYGVIHEGFEDESAWGGVRSTIGGGNHTAPSVTSQGIIWLPNTPNSEVTTGQGAARTGLWGFYELPHGDFGNGVGDGWKGVGVDRLFGVGGWFETNTPPAAITILLDGLPAAVDYPVGNLHVFVGVINTDGFTEFEVSEIEGGPGDQKFIFADDFSVGTGSVTSIGEEASRVVGPLPPAFPNPFRTSTTIRFSLVQEAIVSLTVFDASGRLVRALLDHAEWSAGDYELPWDGRDWRGLPVSSGLYYYSLRSSEGLRATQRVIRVD